MHILSASGMFLCGLVNKNGLMWSIAKTPFKET